jgi:uncharacterized protein
MLWVCRWFALTDAQRAALPTAELDRIVSLTLLVLVDYKFYTLFSILFGMGFAMQLGRSQRPGSEVVRTYVRRLSILLAIGIGHALLLWFGDILHCYALVGFALILFRNASDRVLLRWVVGLAMIVALLPLLQWAIGGIGKVEEAGEEVRFAALTGGSWLDIIGLNFAFIRDEYRSLSPGFDSTFYWYLSVLWKFLLGFVIGRRMLLQRAEGHLDVYRRALPWLLVGGLAGSVLLGGATWHLQTLLPDHRSLWARLLWIPVDLSMLMLSLAYVAVLVLLYQRPGVRSRLCVLAPLGRMALTAYLSQSVAIVLLLYGVGFDLLGKVGATVGMGFVVLIYGLQIAFSGWWLRRFRFGPAEWVWRSLTYGRWQPMRSRA